MSSSVVIQSSNSLKSIVPDPSGSKYVNALTARCYISDSFGTIEPVSLHNAIIKDYRVLQSSGNSIYPEQS